MLSRACRLPTPPASRQAWRSSLSSKRRPLLQPRRQFSHSPVTSKPYDAYRPIGIRREDKSRWERRAPLTPTAVALLIKQTGVKVYVQPSTKRIFSDADYVRVCEKDNLLRLGWSANQQKWANRQGRSYLRISHRPRSFSASKKYPPSPSSPTRPTCFSRIHTRAMKRTWACLRASLTK